MDSSKCSVILRYWKYESAFREHESMVFFSFREKSTLNWFCPESTAAGEIGKMGEGHFEKVILMTWLASLVPTGKIPCCGLNCVP